MLRQLHKSVLAATCAATLFSAPAGSLGATDSGNGPTSQWVHPGPEGRLIYKTTERGDRIMDFSHAGYMGGGVTLPDVPVKRTVKPSGDADDTAAIQTAIDDVAALPLKDGFRGAVLLAPGIFNCSSAITISASGVVLRGSGSGANGTTVKLTGTPHTGIVLRGPRGRGGNQPTSDTESETTREFTPATTTIADNYVSSGAISFKVVEADGFTVGDTVEVLRPVTEAWVRFMEMHDLVRDGRPQTWIRIGNTTTAERTIASLSGNTITLDVPVSDSYDSQYLNPPGTRVVKIRPPARVTQSGIEHLRIESPPQAISHSQRHFSALRVNGQDCWVRDVVCDETMNSVGVGGKRITLERVTVNRKARHQGSSRPAEFAPNGEQILMDRCTVNADNIWFVATGAGHAGPIVVLNCEFLGDSRAESHQRWSTSMLYDNCRAPDGAFEFRNRGSMGSGHGWSMGWGVAWNCVADHYIVQNPPGAANWLIGCIGETTLKPRPFGDGPMLSEGIKDSHGTHVTPQSLYLTQLAERLGPEALKNIGY